MPRTNTSPIMPDEIPEVIIARTTRQRGEPRLLRSPRMTETRLPPRSWACHPIEAVGGPSAGAAPYLPPPAPAGISFVVLKPAGTSKVAAGTGSRSTFTSSIRPVSLPARSFRIVRTAKPGTSPGAGCA